MSEIPHLTMTEEEYLAFEATAPEKHQYVNGEVYAMAGSGFAHSIVTMNMARAFVNAFAGGP